MADTITGLEAEIYFINNPIWTEINTDGVKVIVRVTYQAKQYTLTFDVFDGRVVFDVAIIAKVLMPLPRFDNIYFSPSLNLNFIRDVYFQFLKIDNEGNLIGIDQMDRTFIRGGLPFGNNIPVSVGAALIESTTVPVWNGYPSLFAFVNENNEIQHQPLPPAEITDVRRERTCGGVYLSWLNSKGGYSFWLFETWELAQKAGKSDLIDTYDNGFLYQGFQTTGNETDYSIQVKTIVPNKYFNHISSLVNSPDVWVYNLESLMGYYESLLNPDIPPINNVMWKRIMNNGNTFNWKSDDIQKEVSLSFNIERSENRQLVW